MTEKRLNNKMSDEIVIPTSKRPLQFSSGEGNVASLRAKATQRELGECRPMKRQKSTLLSFDDR